MQLIITHFTTLRRVRDAFNARFPFLKLEFFVDANKDGQYTAPEKLTNHALTFESLSGKTGLMELHDTDTAGNVEQKFTSTFGVAVQVFYKRGANWLLTTTSDKLSLYELNNRSLEYDKPIQHDVPANAADRMELE
ncbi:MAG: hypothetical protein ACK574_03505 [Bacteroidota bacterium]|jgi:hypothetical protein